MKVELVLITLLLFCFTVFLFPDLEAAVAGIGGGEALKPLFLVSPSLLVAGVFFVLIYSAVKGDD